MIELIGCRAAEFVTLQEWGFHEPQNIKDKSESHEISPQKNTGAEILAKPGPLTTLPRFTQFHQFHQFTA